MDPKVDPCQDFFAYACGGFVRDTPIPSDRATWGTSELIQKANEDFLREVLEKAAASPGSDKVARKIGDFYAACMDEPGIEKAGLAPLEPLLRKINQVSSFETLTDAVTALHVSGVFPLFDIDAEPDLKDSSRMLAYVDQAGLGLPDRDYYLKDDGNMKDVRDFYRRHVRRMLELMGVTAAELDGAVADVMRIETKIAGLEQDKVTRRDPYNTYHRIDRTGLAKLAPEFPWRTYLSAVGAPAAKGISVNSPEYFTGIQSLMHEEQGPAWRHYLTWRLGHVLAPFLTKAFVDQGFALRQKITGQEELEPRWKRCLRHTDRALGELLGQSYVAARFAGDSQKRATELTNSIHAAMKEDLRALPWMDQATRQAAQAKLAKMGQKVGYPAHWRVYDFEVTRASYAANAMAADAFDRRRKLTKVDKPVDKTEWDMTPPTVNAYYDASRNEMVLPAGELQPPFFSRDFYAPVNIGDEGANTIGHELTHGFDDEGSKFDGSGNLRQWWTEDTRAKFDAAVQCVRDQYSQYDAISGVKLNGALTSGENIADIGGVKLGLGALAAWRKAYPEEQRSVEGFSDEKLYFLAYAQGWCSKETPQFLEMLARTNQHSPARWRVDGVMPDIPQFGEAFQCKPGSPMTSAKPCAVW
jgi:putative endopeptidase